MIKFNKIYDTFDKVQLNEQVDLDHFYKYGYHRYVHSCTAALEIAALAIDIEVGDEIIMPSYTFVSTANAFALRGAKIVFVDVTEDMNIDIGEINKNITKKTKAVVAVHYGGSSCDMEMLVSLCKEKSLYLIEDAAQAIASYYKGKLLGTFGDIGCFSFHETKNIHCYEGGLIVINNKKIINKVDMIIDKGTDRKAFLNGDVDKYTWQTIGSSYEMDIIRQAYLKTQFNVLNDINQRRKKIVELYQDLLGDFDIFKRLDHNGHLFFIKVADRTSLQLFLAEKGIEAFSHYEPLHLSEAGQKYGVVRTEMTHTITAYNLLRLPVYFDLKDSDVKYIAKCIKEYYE